MQLKKITEILNKISIVGIVLVYLPVILLLLSGHTPLLLTIPVGIECVLGATVIALSIIGGIE